MAKRFGPIQDRSNKRIQNGPPFIPSWPPLLPCCCPRHVNWNGPPHHLCQLHHSVPNAVQEHIRTLAERSIPALLCHWQRVRPVPDSLHRPPRRLCLPPRCPLRLRRRRVPDQTNGRSSARKRRQLALGRARHNTRDARAQGACQEGRRSANEGDGCHQLAVRCVAQCQLYFKSDSRGGLRLELCVGRRRVGGSSWAAGGTTLKRGWLDASGVLL